MAIVRPFKGIRPTPRLAEKVAALPYDVMTSEEARVVVEGNDYSFLHVDRAEIDLDLGTDVYADQVYEKAAENLNAMVKKCILIQDREDSFYIYRLTMNGRSQTGLVVCTSVDEYIEGKIKKHEFTREEKEQDRIKHVDACDANTGPIFLAYRADVTINNILYGWMNNFDTIYDFVADDGVRHEVWVIDNSKIIQKLQHCFLEVESLYIADGHHRNASAVKVAQKRRAQNPNYTADDEFNYYLSVLFPDDQLYIMDYNRVAKDLNGLTTEQFLEALNAKFDVTKCDGQYKPERTHQFGLYVDKNWYRLVAKDAICNDDDPILGLDVSILQNEVLSALLGIEDPRTDKRVDFVGGIRGLDELEKRVDSDEMKVAFAMCPTTIGQLMDVADSGNVMPPKSTWFEPKLRSGLFIHKLS